jgi:chromate reductase
MTTPNDSLRLLGVSGSLRKGSFNTSLLRAAVEIAAAEKLPLSIELADIHLIPPYDEDVRTAGLPEPVERFREAIAAADALLIVTPEYNYSVPGVLKNAIDWASRPSPSGPHPLSDKPFALMGASGGIGGTMRAQYHFRQIAVFLDMHALNKPEVFVRNARAAFDESGKLTDEATRKIVGQQLAALVDWTRRIAREPQL